jgi:hypothetical protein
MTCKDDTVQVKEWLYLSQKSKIAELECEADASALTM